MFKSGLNHSRENSDGKGNYLFFFKWIFTKGQRSRSYFQVKDAEKQATMQVWKGHLPASVMTIVQLFFSANSGSAFIA